MRPELWGMSGTMGVRNGNLQDTDWKAAGMAGDYYNSSSFMRLDPKGGLIGLTNGGGFGHGAALRALLYSKHNGLKAVREAPATEVINSPAYGNRPNALKPFANRGVILYDNKAYMIGPGDDSNGDGTFVGQKSGNPSAHDQGLYIWSYDYSMDDRRGNDGAEGPATMDTADLNLKWTHRFTSSGGGTDPSWLEYDGTKRPKAWLVDNGTVWMAWKPSIAGGVQLIRANGAGADTWDLDVAKGNRGVEIWGKLSLAETGGKKYLTYFAGRGGRRSGTNYTPASGPAALAVFDAEDESRAWTFDLDDAPGLRPNRFWTQIDRSHMVVAGRWAYVGWVDNSNGNSKLRLWAFDVTKDSPAPVKKEFDLGFSADDNGDSNLSDLIAVNGRLYALVYQADRMMLDSNDPRMDWSAQHVVALEMGQ